MVDNTKDEWYLVVAVALKAADWIISGMPSSKIQYFISLILVITVTSSVTAQTESVLPDNFINIDPLNWIFTLSGSPEAPALPYSYSYRQSWFNDSTVFTEPIASDYESFQINPSVEHLTSSSVPEPATICILGVGLLVLIKLCRRRHPVHA